MDFFTGPIPLFGFPSPSETIKGFSEFLVQFELKELPPKNDYFDYSRQPTPYLPPNIKSLIEKGKKRPLKENEMYNLMSGIAQISKKFYEIKDGKFVLIDFNGKVVDTADSEIDLIVKIQGKEYGRQVFAWKIGYEVFSGWST